jgi:pilus assembly protein FimV
LQDDPNKKRFDELTDAEREALIRDGQEPEETPELEEEQEPENEQELETFFPPADEREPDFERGDGELPASHEDLLDDKERRKRQFERSIINNLEKFHEQASQADPKERGIDQRTGLPEQSLEDDAEQELETEPELEAPDERSVADEEQTREEPEAERTPEQDGPSQEEQEKERERQRRREAMRELIEKAAQEKERGLERE